MMGELSKPEMQEIIWLTGHLNFTDSNILSHRKMKGPFNETNYWSLKEFHVICIKMYSCSAQKHKGLGVN